MSVILSIAGFVFGAFLYQPLWFDDTPYHLYCLDRNLLPFSFS